MKYILPFLVLLVGWWAGKWVVGRLVARPHLILGIGRGVVGLLGGILLFLYLYLKFFEGTFRGSFYFPVMGLLAFRISLAYYGLMLGVENKPSKENEDKTSDLIMGRAILIVAFSFMLCWFLIGYFFPGSLGSLTYSF